MCFTVHFFRSACEVVWMTLVRHAKVCHACLQKAHVVGMEIRTLCRVSMSAVDAWTLLPATYVVSNYDMQMTKSWSWGLLWYEKLEKLLLLVCVWTSGSVPTWTVMWITVWLITSDNVSYRLKQFLLTRGSYVPEKPRSLHNRSWLEECRVEKWWIGGQGRMFIFVKDESCLSLY